MRTCKEILNKIYCFFKKKWLIILVIAISVIVFINYSYYLQDESNYKSYPPLISLFNLIDIVSIKVDIFFNNVISTFKEALVIKWLMFFIAAVYLAIKLDLNKLFSNIDEFSLNGLKVSMKAQEKIEEEEEKKSQLEKEENKDNIDKIETIDNKIEIMKLLRDNPYIAGIIDRWINKNVKKTSIPISTLKTEIGDLKILDELFEYYIKGTSIVLTGLKKESMSKIIEVYHEIFDSK